MEGPERGHVRSGPRLPAVRLLRRATPEARPRGQRRAAPRRAAAIGDAQRARPRLRRLRSAGLSLRDLGGAFEPLRAAPIASAAV